MKEPMAGDDAGLGSVVVKEVGDVAEQFLYWRPGPSLDSGI
jgi:hypothetical protein